MPAAHKWNHITDLGDDPKSLTEGELESLRRVWANQKRDLEKRGVLDGFDKRLRREWSIETGIIENVYTLDRGVTQTLIAKGIDAALIPNNATNQDPTRVARIIQDHYDALEGMFDFVKGERPLSTSYIKELHVALLRNQETHTVVDSLGRVYDKPLERGKYRGTPNNPSKPDGSVHPYCPPEHVASEMDRLIALHAKHLAAAVPPEVEAAWLNHRFTQIHPFPDGNGRIARAIASLVFIQAGWFPLIVTRDNRTRYIETLEKADDGDLGPLVALFVEAKRSALVQAAEVAYDVRPVATTDEAIAAVRDRLQQRGKVPPQEWPSAKETARKLCEFATQRLTQVAHELTQEIGRLQKDFAFGPYQGMQFVDTQARDDAIQISGQTADFATYEAATRLHLNAGRNDSLAFSFHAIGPRFRGIIGVLAYLSVQGTSPTLIPDGTFLINYEEDLTTAQTRFSAWLERVIVAGLDAWRRTL